MIRDLTKSAVCCSWARSLLGLKQASNLLTPGRQQGGGDLFAPMTQVAVGQLNESMKGFYRSGDSLQSRMVDMTFALMNPLNWFNPNTWNFMQSMMPMGGCGQNSGGFPRQTTTAQSAAPPGSSPGVAGGGAPGSTPGGISASNQTASAGWGPMP